jgi:AbrB family looped-hinge helix DNA binding protein
MPERVVIDKGGRIVIPKALRKALGLRDGDLVVVGRNDRGLVIRKEEAEGGLVRQGRRLFKPRDHKTGAIDPNDVNRLIEILRDPDQRRALESKEIRRRAAKRRGAE